MHYFGPWNDPQAALQRYLDQKDDLHAGRTPPTPREGLTIKELVNRFLEACEAKLDSGELTKDTFRDYYGTCAKLVKVFGKTRLVEDLRGDDFDKFRAVLAKTNGIVGLRNQITRAKRVFNFAYKAGLIDQPIRYGANFSSPSAKAIRRFQAAQRRESPRMFEAADREVQSWMMGSFHRPIYECKVRQGAVTDSALRKAVQKADELRASLTAAGRWCRHRPPRWCIEFIPSASVACSGRTHLGHLRRFAKLLRSPPLPAQNESQFRAWVSMTQARNGKSVAYTGGAHLPAQDSRRWPTSDSVGPTTRRE